MVQNKISSNPKSEIISEIAAISISAISEIDAPKSGIGSIQHRSGCAEDSAPVGKATVLEVLLENSAPSVPQGVHQNILEQNQAF